MTAPVILDSAPPNTLLSSLLVSLQLTDSAFPSGFYTLSHGLEGFAQAGMVDPEGLAPLLSDLLHHGIGPSDATALALAHTAAVHRSWGQVAEVDERLYATKLSREIRVAATRTGRQMLDLARQVFPSEAVEEYAAVVARREAPGNQAVVAAVIQAGMGVPRQQAVATDLFAFCAAFAGAALRLRLTDHRKAQVLLREAAPVVEEVTAAAVRRELADLGGCIPTTDALSGRHERSDARLFAN
ncbi:urease accessory protein [Streptomyces sp. NBC_01387]|uniref:urease accessory protein UreF n=1 Tax=unclassified Streptomyces TaxID=2593676 RepID=UPI00202506EB|nr:MULTISPECIES: urease accessory UreF family protein [unclassified Streptomyces]MCX4551466.1 urease accessory protein [Streptomyces sp. NBC_01500]WSC22854.1 urease accessory protein [Streptomyces sp. NBC_01766]WSV56765.1 urease accessory protein [Streptomyces sp. NBC_01014]